MKQPPKHPWFADSAQSLANDYQLSVYIVTRTDECGPFDGIFFGHELEDADLPNVLWGFQPEPV